MYMLYFHNYKWSQVRNSHYLLIENPLLYIVVDGLCLLSFDFWFAKATCTKNVIFNSIMIVLGYALYPLPATSSSVRSTFLWKKFHTFPSLVFGFLDPLTHARLLVSLSRVFLKPDGIFRKLGMKNDIGYSRKNLVHSNSIITKMCWRGQGFSLKKWVFFVLIFDMALVLELPNLLKIDLEKRLHQ